MMFMLQTDHFPKHPIKVTWHPAWLIHPIFIAIASMQELLLVQQYCPGLKTPLLVSSTWLI